MGYFSLGFGCILRNIEMKAVKMEAYPILNDNIPYLTTDQMREVDRAMIDDYKIELIQMMENAGRNLAHLARNRFFGGNAVGKQVVVLAGTGGNGGGALVSARRLHNYGATVSVIISKPDVGFTEIPAHQLDILRRMDITIGQSDTLSNVVTPDLIIDGVIGYSLKGAPRQTTAVMIRWANKVDAPILSLDTPSGIDTTTGTVFDPAIRARATMTLALPKEGLRAEGVKENVGELYLADISVPPQLYNNPTLKLTVGHIFAHSDIVRLW